MKDQKHGVSTEEADELLEVLRACAWAPPAEKHEKLPFDHHYKEAVQKLKESDAWVDNPQVKAWLLSKWLPNPQVYKSKLHTCMQHTLMHTHAHMHVHTHTHSRHTHTYTHVHHINTHSIVHMCMSQLIQVHNTYLK